MGSLKTKPRSTSADGAKFRRVHITSDTAPGRYVSIGSVNKKSPATFIPGPENQFTIAFSSLPGPIVAYPERRKTNPREILHS
jgi:hypothetical protein